MNQAQRIQAMEHALDVSSQAVSALSRALDQYEGVLKEYRKLCDYYGSARWMKDYEADEAGKLPQGLKRGVLSEDAVYDLMDETRQLTLRLMRLAARMVEIR